MNNYSELFEFAMQIEENGQRFYQQAVLISGDETARRLFQYLADEEAKHFQRFQHLNNQAQTYHAANSDALDSFSFLKAFIKNIIFTADKTAERDALRTPREIIRFALERESRSILFYEEIKRVFSQNVVPILDQIIGEEIQHYLKLSNLQEHL